MGEADQLEKLSYFAPPTRGSTQLLMKLEHLGGRQPIWKAEELCQVPKRCPRGKGRRRMPADGHRPAARFYETTADLDERGLARAVRAEQAEELSLVDDEIDSG
jgi:hypothetical protein